MATRMQQRRGTAAQWISTNSGNGPILNAGEIGYETDTNKFKIGDGTNHWVNLDYFIDANSTVNPAFGSSITFEGATADGFETTLQITDPTADRTITIPNVTGTVITTGNLSDITDIGIFTSTIVMEGSTADAHELTLSAGEPTADRTITFPDETGTVATQEYVDSEIGGAEVDQSTLAGNGISWNAGTSKFDVDTTTIQARVTDVTDTEIGYLNGVTSAVQTQLDAKSTESKTETLTNKTLTSPKINEDVAITATATELNYVDGVTSAIQTQLNALAPKADPTFTGTISAAALTLSGDLTVNGTTTTINSTTLAVDDKNIVLGDVATPSDVTADGGGITLKGATDKTFNWVDATDAWTSSEDLNLLTGKVYEINGTTVLSGSALGSGVTGSSLTSVGTIATGVWNGTTIAIANGGTGATTASTAAAALLPAQASNSGKYLTTDGSGTLSWGTVTGYSAPTLGSTSIASGATVTTIVGLTKIRSDQFTTLDASGFEVDLETMAIMGAF
jgi:hypothetical protein